MLGLEIIEYIAELFLLKEECLSGKKARERVIKAYVIVAIIVVIIFGVFFFYINPLLKEISTKDTMLSMTYLLKLEKERTGIYPNEIGSIARRDPTYGDLTIDSWNNEIIYQKKPHENHYNLISKGCDGQLYTKDDIVIQSSDK